MKGRVVLTKRPTLCAQPHLKSVSYPIAALLRSFPPHHRANTRCVGHFIKMTLPQNTNSHPSPYRLGDLAVQTLPVVNHLTEGLTEGQSFCHRAWRSRRALTAHVIRGELPKRRKRQRFFPKKGFAKSLVDGRFSHCGMPCSSNSQNAH